MYCKRQRPKQLCSTAKSMKSGECKAEGCILTARIRWAASARCADWTGRSKAPLWRLWLRHPSILGVWQSSIAAGAAFLAEFCGFIFLWNRTERSACHVDSRHRGGRPCLRRPAQGKSGTFLRGISNRIAVENADTVSCRLDQCRAVLSDGSQRPPGGGWFVLQLPAPGDYPVANRRKSGAKATVYTPLPRATIWGPIPAPFRDSFALSSYCLRFFIFCEAADIISCNKDRAVFEIEAATKPGNPLFGGEPGRASGTDNRCPTLGC